MVDFVDKITSYRNELLDSLKTGDYMNNSCKVCTRKRKQIWTDNTDFSIINVGGHPSPCNFKCSYCDARSDDNTVAFSAKLLDLYSQTLTALKLRNQICDNARVMLANGEITVNPAQHGFLALADGYESGILTNASVFSQSVADKISEGKSYLLVSVDAGTSKTFKKSKGVDLFDKVYANLKKYSKYGKIVIKYILIPGINDNDDDFTGVAGLLNNISEDSIWVSTDMYMLGNDTTHLNIEPLAKFVRFLSKKGIRAYGYDAFLSDNSCKVLRKKLIE
jgi:wyosine [tRNA(Phe)-imidazoG37] synthetase (radical SAM superfamily)